MNTKLDELFEAADGLMCNLRSEIEARAKHLYELNEMDDTMVGGCIIAGRLSDAYTLVGKIKVLIWEAKEIHDQNKKTV